LKATVLPSTSAPFWALWPAYVWAASEALSPAEVPLLTWVAISGAAVLGFLISSAEDLFGWMDERQARALGKLVSRFAASLAAGFIAYWFARLAGMVEIYALIAVTPAAYAGENYIRRLADKKAENDAGRV
jgi:hypothetical protein